jgi:hypothetical protein
MSFDGYHHDGYCFHHPKYPYPSGITNNPPAIIYINPELSSSIIQTFTTQLYLSQVYMCAADFDGYIAQNPDYYAQVHLTDQRILVLRHTYDHTNRDLADFVLYAKNGMVSILRCRHPQPRKTLSIANIYITAITQRGYDFWDYYRHRCCDHEDCWRNHHCCHCHWHHFWWYWWNDGLGDFER